MTEWLKVIVLGVVEGVTEFLPISSTGHLIVTAEYMALQESLTGTFEIFIQIGAVMAVILYYWRELLAQARTIRTQPSTQQLWLGVAVAFIPAALIGLLVGDQIEAVLFSPTVVALALIVGGVLFLVVERVRVPQIASQSHVGAAPSLDAAPLTLRQALIVGCWQVLALVPGMSRSGMSIIGGMLAGLDRPRATQFSFYLAIPTLGAATMYTLVRSLDSISVSDFALLMLGAVVSGVVAWFAIAWLLRYVAAHSFVAFGYYRIAVGIIILLMVR